MAWEDMDEEEKKFQRQQIGKVFIGKVTAEILTTNLTLEVQEEFGTAYYPLEYAGGEKAEVIDHCLHL
jgi:hypothetical protein